MEIVDRWGTSSIDSSGTRSFCINTVYSQRPSRNFCILPFAWSNYCSRFLKRVCKCKRFSWSNDEVTTYSSALEYNPWNCNLGNDGSNQLSDPTDSGSRYRLACIVSLCCFLRAFMCMLTKWILLVPLLFGDLQCLEVSLLNKLIFCKRDLNDILYSILKHCAWRWRAHIRGGYLRNWRWWSTKPILNTH